MSNSHSNRATSSRRNRTQRENPSDRQYDVDELMDIKCRDGIVCMKVKWTDGTTTWNNAEYHDFHKEDNKVFLTDLLRRLLSNTPRRRFDRYTRIFLDDLGFDLTQLRKDIRDQLAVAHAHASVFDGRTVSLADFAREAEFIETEFGGLSKAKFAGDNKYYILKRIDRTLLRKEEVEYLLAREISVNNLLRHPNIVRMHTTFVVRNNSYLVLDYAAGGDLQERLGRIRRADGCPGRFDEPTAARYTFQIASALQYCHGQMVIHRDLKLGNVLLDSTGRVLLADFGLSLVASSKRRSMGCGTHHAPEMFASLNCSPRYGKEVDLWALGNVVFALLTGTPPFETLRSGRYVDDERKILEGRYQVPRYVSRQASDLIDALLQPIPRHRLRIDKVLVHPWIESHRP